MRIRCVTPCRARSRGRGFRPVKWRSNLVHPRGDRQQGCCRSTDVAIFIWQQARIQFRTCWPRRQLIWEKLTCDPLAPVPVMSAMQLCRNGFSCPPGRHACGC